MITSVFWNVSQHSLVEISEVLTVSIITLNLLKRLSISTKLHGAKFQRISTFLDSVFHVVVRDQMFTYGSHIIVQRCIAWFVKWH